MAVSLEHVAAWSGFTLPPDASPQRELLQLVLDASIQHLVENFGMPTDPDELAELTAGELAKFDQATLELVAFNWKRKDTPQFVAQFGPDGDGMVLTGGPIDRRLEALLGRSQWGFA